MTDLFFHKSLEWGYEEEWRIVRRLEYADKQPISGVYLFNLPPLCVKSVIFGCQMLESDRKLILETLLSTDYGHISVQQSVLESDQFALRLEPVPQPTN